MGYSYGLEKRKQIVSNQLVSLASREYNYVPILCRLPQSYVSNQLVSLASREFF